ncbi:hypothetical protein F9230_07510 [Acinetobacter johnsonii]|uniref:hypothetical protein n=1 Tax=Acinetobacter johnsonii TaxID=40214 RepID=UPI001F2B6CD3|nr:hypothetical protein [Acinetobacter johnsonii]UJA04203.1 hypothetical protein F9230_07510 [Acinetobacter johnsonii]
MDLRDQFAIAALQGLLANSGMNTGNADFVIAEATYRFADAMIAEREKDDVETKDKIKQMLVDAINEKHPGLNPSTVCTAEHLIFNLTTGLPF